MTATKQPNWPEITPPAETPIQAHKLGVAVSFLLTEGYTLFKPGEAAPDYALASVYHNGVNVGYIIKGVEDAADKLIAAPTGYGLHFMRDWQAITTSAHWPGMAPLVGESPSVRVSFDPDSSFYEQVSHPLMNRGAFAELEADGDVTDGFYGFMTLTPNDAQEPGTVQLNAPEARRLAERLVVFASWLDQGMAAARADEERLLDAPEENEDD